MYIFKNAQYKSHALSGIGNNYRAIRKQFIVDSEEKLIRDRSHKKKASN